MSVRFRLCAGAILAASMVTGLALGDHATTWPVRDLDYDFPEPAAADSVYARQPEDRLRGPAEIVCKGCGPTLADRRFAADMAALDADGMIDGSRDPVVVDYMRHEVDDAGAATPYSHATETPSTYGLSVNVQRFADGGNSGPMPPVAARTLMNAPATEPVVAP